MINLSATGRVLSQIFEPLSDQAVRTGLRQRLIETPLDLTDVPTEFVDVVRDNGDKIRGESPYIDPKALEAIQNGHNVPTTRYKDYPRDTDGPELFV
jgi:hypothetical protein